METVIILALVGFLLVVAEMFLPGLVLGILGFLLITSSVILGYARFGPLTGSIVFGAVTLLSIVGFFVWMNVFPHTAVGRRLTLSTAQPVGNVLPASDNLVGHGGTALTPLRPSGKALIDGRRIDVLAESEFVDAGDEVVVIAARDTRVHVRKKV